MSVMIEA